MQHNGWEHALNVTGGGAGLVGHGGAVLLRKAADQAGLTVGLGAAEGGAVAAARPGDRAFGPDRLTVAGEHGAGMQPQWKLYGAASRRPQVVASGSCHPGLRHMTAPAVLAGGRRRYVRKRSG